MYYKTSVLQDVPKGKFAFTLLLFQNQLPLNKTSKLLMKYMSSMFHQPLILGRRIATLTILDGPLKHVGELGLVAQEVGSNPVHHAPILHQVVLKRITRQNDPSSCSNLLQSLQKLYYYCIASLIV